MEPATVSGGTATAPVRAADPTSGISGPKPIPSALGWVEQIAGMAILTAQTALATVTPPYNWGSEFLDQCWLCAKRAFIPLMFCTAVFSWGAPGITGGSIISTLATPDRL